MVREDEWYIYIQDHDRRLYALAGPVSEGQVDDWIDTVVQEQDKSRELISKEINRALLLECQTHAKSNVISETTVENLVASPRDRSNFYSGELPN